MMSITTRTSLAGLLFLAGTFLAFGLQEQHYDAMITSPSEVNSKLSTPKSVLIDVPFTSQAPFADWGDPYQEACEEAALIMVHHFLNQTALPKEQADNEILALTAWEEEQSLPQDVTLEELAWVAANYYGYQTRILEDPSIDDLKAEIAKGNPIIVPAAGRDLGNPYFSGEGPWYHMLVLIGYDQKHFITNDPGTRRGKHYRYTFAVLHDAIHNWTGAKEDIRDGIRLALVVTR